MNCIGKEDLANLVPRVLSLIRDSSSVEVFGRYLTFHCGIQDINFLEEKGLLFNYQKQFGFYGTQDSFVVMLNLNYWFDMFLRWQCPMYKTFLPKDYRERLKKYELRTPIDNPEPSLQRS